MCTGVIVFFFMERDQHAQDIESLLPNLYAAGVLLRVKKCYWLTTKVKYFGRATTTHKLSITEAHTKELKDMKHPHKLT